MDIYYKQTKKPVKLLLLWKVKLYEITDIRLLLIHTKSALIIQPNRYEYEVSCFYVFIGV